jgi:hypothetical protein
MSKVFDNPLIYPIRQLLAAAEGNFTEHQLIKLLQQDIEAIPGLATAPRLALFQTHFLVMNALYQLQDELFRDNIYLHISPLDIALQTINAKAANRLAAADSHCELKQYYSDSSHFQLTDAQQVDDLLASFWQHYLAQDKQAEAYQCLQLQPGAGWSSVKSAYRRLAADCHPDRGGDPAQFVLIRQAYEVLAKTIGSSKR